MANSILRNGPVQPSPANAQNGMPFNPQMIQQIKQFKNSLKGNPKQMVMQMLQQGQITNPHLQQAIQMARQFKGFF